MPTTPKRKKGFIDREIERVALLDIKNREEGLQFLVNFFGEIRPNQSKDKKSPEQNLQRLIQLLHQYPLLLENLQKAIFSQLINTDLSATLTESGIPLARGFWQELSDRLKHKILPPLQDESDFLFVIDRIFFRSNDIEWVEKIPREAWIYFFENIGLTLSAENPRLQVQLLKSLRVLSFQVAQLGLEKDVIRYLEKDINQNPFLIQNQSIQEIEKLPIEKEKHELSIELFQTAKDKIAECVQKIQEIRDHQAEHGASISLTYMLLILQTRLDRMHIILDVLDRDRRFDTGKLVDLFIQLVRNENKKNSIREFASLNFGYLAYRIAEHKGNKGDKYITSTRSDYWKMIVSSMWGGLIISFVAIFKNLLGKLPFAPFWHGFVYSVNYSAGFIAIEQTNSTLATKQPAFTASAVASSLDMRKNNTRPNLYNLAITVAKVSRSQIASFFGNLVIVFPVSFLLAWLYAIVTGDKVTSTEQAWKMLKDQHPWQSPALLYACFTGFFLFASGIIAGFIQNKIQYATIGKRLEMHPLLKMTMSRNRLNRMAYLIEKNAGSIVGNIALGFFLGMSGIFVKIFGLPFDIRHITIAAGNCAIAVQEIGFFNIPIGYLLTVFFGVIGIGLFNFLVSFSLAFVVAVKSRGVHLRDYPEFLRILGRYFLKNPMDFIRPRSKRAMEN